MIALADVGSMAGVKRFPSAFHPHRRTRFAVPCHLEPAKQIACFSEAASLLPHRADAAAGHDNHTVSNSVFAMSEALTVAAAIPEPSSSALLGGLGMLALLRRR